MGLHAGRRDGRVVLTATRETDGSPFHLGQGCNVLLKAVPLSIQLTSVAFDLYWALGGNSSIQKSPLVNQWFSHSMKTQPQIFLWMFGVSTCLMRATGSQGEDRPLAEALYQFLCAVEH